jgi:hypothetical protein
MSIRKGWTVTPAVSVNKAQDMVHRAVGKAGVVLVAEGGFAVRALLNDEKKKMERFAPGVPVHELIVGTNEGEISVRKLQKRMKKFPKKLSTVQVRELRARLKAVGGMNIALPKGPMPKKYKDAEASLNFYNDGLCDAIVETAPFLISDDGWNHKSDQKSSKKDRAWLYEEIIWPTQNSKPKNSLSGRCSAQRGK